MPPEKINEFQLAAKCRETESGAADELYRRYAARLLALCRRYTSSLEDAEDLMQETLIKTLDKIGSFRYRGEGSLYAWISRIAINLALNEIRKRKRELPTDSLDPGEDIPDPAADEVAGIPRERLMEMISRLPQARKAVFNLYCIDGYSHKEIGKMLGISEKGSASALAKAKDQLKRDIYRYLKEEQ